MARVLDPKRLMWLLGRLVRPFGPLPSINHLEACTPTCTLLLGLHRPENGTCTLSQ